MTDYLNDLKFSTFIDLLRYRALDQPNKVGFTFLQDGETESSSLTYQELDRQARAIAQELQLLGVAKGERALLLYTPGLEFIPAFFGCLYAGVVAVPAYPPHLNRPMPRLQAIVVDTQATVVLTTAQILSNGSRLFTHTPELGALQWLATDSLTGGLEDHWQKTEVTSDTLAFLQYTSGSTSTPKGVMVNHGNLLHNQQLIKSGFGHTEQTIVVGWLPLFHDMGLIGNMLQPLYLGTECILMPPVAFLQNPFRWLQAICRYKATTSGGPNFAYDLCVSKITPEQRATLDLSSWEVAFNGAEPVRAETIERFARTFADSGFRQKAFYPCYGMAETTLIVSGGTKEAPPVFQSVEKAALEQSRVIPATLEDGATQKLVSSGQPLQDLRVVIAHPETLTRCAPGEVGEIWVSGNSVTQGYWRRTEETEPTFRAYLKDSGEGSFLRTGDLGFLYSGELFVTGRLKDLIIIRGRNHYPQDIELTLEQSHSALQPTCSAAFAIDVTGEERLAVVVEVKRSHLRHLNVEEVVKAIRQAVAEQHELQVYGVLLLKPGSIPKTSSGKIQRHACRADYLNGSLDVVGSSILEDTYVMESKDKLTREALLAIESKHQKPLLESYLQECVARVLKIAPNQLDLQQPLSSLGLDSLMATELQHSIETDLGVVLPMTSFLEGDSIVQLVSLVLTQLAAPNQQTTLVPVVEADVEQPLSYGQRSLWFLYQLAPLSPAYNIVNAVRIKGDIDIPALQRAFEKLVERHPALRTTFTAYYGEPVQQVHQQRVFDFHKQDISTWSEESVNQRLLEEAHRPFNLERGPLMRVNLFARSAQEHILQLGVHHIVGDFWSLAVLVQELGILYEAQKDGTSVSLAPLPLQYTDYSRATAEMLASAEGERFWAYWQKQLAGHLPVLNLSTDRPRPLIQTYQGATVPFKLSADLTQRLKAHSRTQGATLYMTLLAAFKVLLHRYTGQEDILVGSPTAGRNRADFAALVGYFVNPVVLRSDMSGNPTFLAFLGQVQQTVIHAFEHQDYSFALLVERLQPVRDPSRSPLFQTMFVLQKAHILNEEGLASFALGETGARMHLGKLEMESLALEQRVAQFDLTLTMAEVDGELAASLEYNTDLFDAATIMRMASHFQTLLESILANPHHKLSELSILSKAELHQLLVEFNQNQSKIRIPRQEPGNEPKSKIDQCVHELFAAQVERTPDAVAVEFANEKLSYRELNLRANQLAHYLKFLGVGSDVLVSICLERSPQMLVGILAILKAGGAYVPLDPAYPPQRLALMLEDSQSSVLITQQKITQWLPKHKAKVVSIDTDWEVIACESQENPVNNDVTAENLAYVIYTSGSTGVPKGVMIPHGALTNYTQAAADEYELDIGDRVLQFASISFDAAAEEIFPCLIRGGTLVLRTDAMLSSVRVFLQKCCELELTVLDLPTAFWHQVASGLATEGCILPKQLRLVLIGGEKALKTQLTIWQKYATNSVRLVNTYGPTETTIVATKCDLSELASAEVPIGSAIPNVQTYVLDNHLQPVPIGVVGELYIGGVGVARGYLNRPDLTADKFISNPYSQEPIARLYKTGDLVRYLSNGNLEFIGRIDHQVKIRGFRIELGEIEAVLNQYPGVREVVVLDREDIPGEKRLVAYVVPDQEQPITTSELRRFLKEKLPEYMVPSAFILLDKLPLTPNGKVDRLALPAPDGIRPELEETFVAPRNPVEEVLALIWSEVLRVEQVGIYDNFFELGGHSLLATQVLSRLRDIFQVELPLHVLFEATTVAKLSQHLIALERKPGQTEKIAQIIQNIEAMSGEDINKTLQQKKR
ncbi:non-ribosomal peptide synthetase [Brasilonema octagenarum UFV-E1]|uniref:Non-ribosomal peptide synthetase n=2 Tax=Brasilonema TaxID=383614 RepID=A0A856MMW8_9CYAN|nr:MULTISPECIES: non-ribosomal peptide synthetase [Brasilonema]NMF64063.1 non-ribosomal peptide synthetase [Brasilonema octagenarum UFV-OR1]QDL11454.1 non-ribosomal peptide synthetase [Brasilonema sennae CENA114]QDL17844.1 non-ribosomal peptide synthetase [Brasilonema octagenarum UFV-E1]